MSTSTLASDENDNAVIKPTERFIQNRPTATGAGAADGGSLTLLSWQSRV